MMLRSANLLRHARKIRSIIIRKETSITQQQAGFNDMKKLTTKDKRVMVWGGAFKNVAEVPGEVLRSQYVKAQERMRIKLNIVGIFATLAACGVMAFMGRRDAEMGKTYHQIVMERHAKAQEDFEKQQQIPFDHSQKH
jgi:hypothetical protein